jgi:hypothetical protein
LIIYICDHRFANPKNFFKILKKLKFFTRKYPNNIKETINMVRLKSNHINNIKSKCIENTMDTDYENGYKNKM